MARGRLPAGPKLVEGLEGSARAKQRLKVILETIAGEHSVEEACAELGIGTAAFHKLRARTLEGALASLGPRPLGRPRREISEEGRRIGELEKEVWQLQFDLKASRLREELALALPHVLRREEKVEEEKKTRKSRRRQRRARKKAKKRR